MQRGDNGKEPLSSCWRARLNAPESVVSSIVPTGVCARTRFPYWSSLYSLLRTFCPPHRSFVGHSDTKRLFSLNRYA